MQKNTSTSESKNQNSSQKLLTYADLSTFCEQLGLILGSGITVIEGFYIMLEEAGDEASKSLFGGIINELELGNQLSKALSKSGVFPAYMISMIQIGEISGRLETVFNSLALYYAREDNLRKTIKHSVTYPLIMVAMMLLVITVLVVNVMPIFNSVFQQLGSEITGFSKFLMDIGTGISENIAVIFVLLGVIVLLVLLTIFTKKGQELFKNFKDNFFATRGIVENIAVARFAGGLSLMLSSGLDTDDSLNMVERMVENNSLKTKIKALRNDMQNGSPFSKAMIENKIFAGVYARMLAVGFKTGQVDGVMESISKRYDEDVTRRLENVVSIIEPTIVAVLSVIVGAILLSVMLPLMSIISHMG